MNKNKGFTLIELLVVIAIIGILSSVVLASLNSARNKGADAAIKSSLNNIRAQAELYYDDHPTTGYGAEATTDNCGAAVAGVVTPTVGMFVDPNIKNMISGAAGTYSATGDGICVSSDGLTGTTGTLSNQWAISMPLKTSSGSTSWCVNSSGVSKTGTATYNATTFTAMCV